MTQENAQISPKFKGLRTLLTGEAEYFGHGTALFFLGQIAELPPVVTIVSPRRRRNRQFFDREIVFVCHPPERLKPVQQIACENEFLRVSTLEKTLVDLLSDHEHAPEIKTLCSYFCALPYNPSILVNIAKSTSDSVLKRATFFSGWAGRITYPEIPFSEFSRTPVKLDPRSPNTELIWDRRFFIKFPKVLLSFGPREIPPFIEVKFQEWMELRAFPAFLDFLSAENFFPILAPPQAREKQVLSKFFHDRFLSLPKSSLYELLKDFPIAKPTIKPGKFPEVFKTWIKENPKILLNRKSELESWVKNHIHSSNTSLIETALTIGQALGMHTLVIESLEKNGYRLFSSGRFSQLKSVCEKYLSPEFQVPAQIYIFMARTYAGESNFTKAIEVIDCGKAFFEDKEENEVALGELAFALGNIFRQMGKYHESLSELFLAREYYLSAKDSRGIGMVDLSLGNVFFQRGRARDAKIYYYSSFLKMKELGHRAAQASALANIGLVDYDTGNLRKANLSLSRAMGIHRMLKNSWNEAVIGVSRGKVLLTMGNFSVAAKIFKDCYHQKYEQGHLVGTWELAALLGWIKELTGRMGASKAWWNLVPDKDELMAEPRALFVIKALRAMTCLYRNQLPDAETKYLELRAFAEAQERSQVALGDSLHGIGVTQVLSGKIDGLENLKKAREELSANKSRVQFMGIEIFAKIFFPSDFPDIDLDQVVSRYLFTQAYDPFWGLYAHKMIDMKSSEVKQYLTYHLKKTPIASIRTLLANIPHFRDTLKKIEIDSQKNTGFLTHFTDGSSQPIHFHDYEKWKKKPLPPNHFIFDGPTGIAKFASNLTVIKPSSISHGLLCNLISAFPHPLDLEMLYNSVWGTHFEPECDLGAMKSATQRLQKVLGSVNPTIKLRKRRGRSLHGSIEIVISCRWEAVL